MKKTVGIITFHASHNYGSMLQAYALQQVILSLGFECEIINFRTLKQKTFYKPIWERGNIFGKFKRLLLYAPFHNKLLKKHQLFEEFLQTEFRLLKKEYATLQDLEQANLRYDYYISGSDQIWNTHCFDFDWAYFLPFVENGERIAYAPSMGPAAGDSVKSEYYDFYNLTGINVNESTIQSQYEKENIYTENDGRLSGFRLTLSASNLNDGNYSFAMSAINYICQLAVSDEAVAQKAGYVKMNNGSPSTSLPMTYTYESKNNTISAVRNGIFVFDYWELYYQDENGDFTVLVEDYINENASININFGQAPFNQEFKLVAYFTDEDAVLIDFPNVNSDRIKSVSLGGELYNGETKAIAPNSNVTLEIVTNKNYQLDLENFEDVIGQLYSGGSTANLLAEERLNEETGETTYIFNLNTGYLSSSTIINIDLRATRVGGDENGMLYVYIFVPLAIVLIAIVVVILLKRKNGKGKGKTKQKVKETSYKDYYM